MKKKGFTLVELLAVIVVLAIVALIAVPTVLGIISRVRLNALKDSAYGLVEAGTMYNAQYENNHNIRFDIEDNEFIYKNTNNELKYKGNVKEGTVIINKKGKTTVCISDGTNSAYKNYNETKVTLLKKQRCYIPENSYIVYLDDGSENGNRTLSEYTNEELTDIVDSLQEQINSIAIDKIYPVGSIYISTSSENPSSRFGGTWERYGKGKTIVSVDEEDDDFKANSKGGSKTTTLDSKNLPSHSHTYTPSGSISSTFTGSSATTSSTSKTLTGTFRALRASYASQSGGNFSIVSGQSGIFTSSVWTENSAYPRMARITTKTDAYGYDTITINATHTHNLTAKGSVSSTFTGTKDSTATTGDGEAFSNLPPYITVYMYKRTA